MDVDKSREIVSNIVVVLLIRCVKYIHTDDESTSTLIYLIIMPYVAP